MAFGSEEEEFEPVRGAQRGLWCAASLKQGRRVGVKGGGVGLGWFVGWYSAGSTRYSVRATRIKCQPASGQQVTQGWTAAGAPSTTTVEMGKVKSSELACLLFVTQPASQPASLAGLALIILSVA